MTSPAYSPRKTAWWSSAVYGLLAAGAALTASEIFAAAALSVPSLVVAVGDQVIDSSWMPMWFDEWTKELFEVEDDSVTSARRKNALIAGIVITTLLAGVVVGLLARRSAASGSGSSDDGNSSDGSSSNESGNFWQQTRHKIKQAWRQRHIWLAPLVFAVFGILGGLAAASRPGSPAVLSGVSAGTAALAGFAVFHVLTEYFPVYAKSAGDAEDEAAPAAYDSVTVGNTRRRFLVTAGVSALALSIANILGSNLSRRVNVEGSREGELVGGALEEARSRLTPTSTTIGTTAPPSTATTSGTTSGPSSTQPGTTAPAETTAPPATSTTLPANLNNVSENISPLITPNEDFYLIDTALRKPAIQAEDWTLAVQGMVDDPKTYTFAELLDGRFPFIQEPVTLSCVSNRVGGSLVGNAIWEGVPLREVLDASGVQPGATQISGRSVDDWASGFPTELAYDGRVAMIAVTMNGEPLPVKHGFPARLVIAGLYGYVSATKWLSEINLTTWEGFDSYWVPRGWAKEGPIRTQSRIDVPRDGEAPAGIVPIAGVAWAPNKSIDKVEVQIDDNPWAEADLSAELSTNSWRQWVYYWEATPGEYRIQVRATDGTGYTQTAERRPPAPDGATGWHMRTVRVV